MSESLDAFRRGRRRQGAGESSRGAQVEGELIPPGPTNLNQGGLDTRERLLWPPVPFDSVRACAVVAEIERVGRWLADTHGQQRCTALNRHAAGSR